MSPTIRGRATATTEDALANVKFADIPASGAIVNGWFRGATETDKLGLSIGDRDLMVASQPNVSADSINVNEDQMIFNEVVGGGHLYLPVTAVTTEVEWQIHIRYL